MSRRGVAFGEAPILALSIDLVEALLDQLPRAPYFVKDCELRYVSANAAMLDLCGVRSRAEFIGKTARDFFPEVMRRRYEALDREVMRSRRPITHQLELSVRTLGRPVWLLFGRWPVTTHEGELLGIAAIARALDAPDRRHPTYERLSLAVEHIQENFRAPLDISSLARRVGVSVSQLERDFVDLFGLSPQGYLTKVRLEWALRMLEGEKPIVEIAQACGYADQSAFTRRFRATVGMSPTEYRRSHEPPE